VQKISQNQVFLISVGAVAIGFILSILFFGLLHNRALLTKQQNGPTLHGSYKNDLKIEQVTEGLSYPTSMSFVEDNKILVLEKNTGLVRLISDGVLQNKAERGLLGIVVLHKNNNKTNVVNTNVFLYFTESDNNALTKQRPFVLLKMFCR
jgi:glucose/arabinose dehydrogenase